MQQQFSSTLLEKAVAEFSKLPGIGRKTALRLVLFMLKRKSEDVELFADTISRMRREVKYCRVCHNISDTDVCPICSDSRRDASTICVVENVQDVLAIENTQQFHGLYHVLGRTVNCLLQLHIAQEETKFGFSFDECREMLAGDEWKKLGNVRICGLMGMATNTDNIEQIKAEFRSLNNFFQEAKATWFSNAEWFRELSMGMSHDYHEAIAAGSTLVRVGSKIFGERIY